MAISVRPVRQDERQVWERLFRAYAAFYHVELAAGTPDAVWGWICDPANDFWCDLAQDAEGTVVGLVQYQLMHRSLGGGMVCYLSDLYVDPALRGGGAGRAMIDHVLAFAAQRGLPSVRWLTQESNETARRLYDTYAPRSEFVLYSVAVRKTD